VTDFPPFRLDRENRCVWAHHTDSSIKRLSLAPRAYDILQYLVDHAGRLITHDEFLDALWRNVHVQPQVLKTHILAIRTALGDCSDRPRFIETRRGRGYRFIAPVLKGNAAEVSLQPDRSGADAFVGRAPQLDRLKDLLDEARSGQPRIVFIAGESGIGKSALVHRFMDSLGADSTVLSLLGHCVESQGDIEPYYPVLDALARLIRSQADRGIADTLTSVSPGWAAQLAAAMPQQYRMTQQGPTSGTAGNRMLREICEFLEVSSQQRPLVLILEDLHWSDHATADMLAALARRPCNARLMVIGTYQPEGVGTTHHALGQLIGDLRLRKRCHEIVLEPLDERAIADYLAYGTPPKRRHDGIDSFAQLMCERSGGNPLFLLATLDHLAGLGLARSTTDGWALCRSPAELRLEVPSVLNQIIERRFEKLPAAHRRALEGASVAGCEFNAITAAPAARMNAEDFEDICETLCRQQSFIRHAHVPASGDRLPVRFYAFRHTIYRQCLYERQGTLRTARAHMHVADALEALLALEERDDLAAGLARHVTAASDWERSVGHLCAAIRAAKQRLAYRDTPAINVPGRSFDDALPDMAESRCLDDRTS